MKNSTYFDSLKIAFTCSGTFIGAGFASGQELLQFFIAYGHLGFIGLLFAGILFYLFSRRLLRISYKHHLYSQSDLMHYLFTAKTAAFMDLMLSLFLFAVLIIMLAGAGNIASDLFYIEPQYGSILLLTAIIIAALPGFGSIKKINTAITPLLCIAILSVTLHSLSYHGAAALAPKEAYYAYQAVPTWILASLIYVSYNLILGAAILTPLGGNAPEPVRLDRGSTISSIILICLSILIAAALLIHFPNITAMPMPMLEISCTQTPFHTTLYSFALLAAMFTTSLSCLYGCAAKCNAALPRCYHISIILIGLVALCFSHIGFTRLISLIFPVFGLVGFIVLYKLATINKAT